MGHALIGSFYIQGMGNSYLMVESTIESTLLVGKSDIQFL